MSTAAANTSPATAAAANARLIESAYASFAAGDVPAVVGALADDISWHIPGRHPLSGDYVGQAEVLAFFQTLTERSEGTFRLEIGDLLAGGEKVAALVTERGRREGKELECSSVHVWGLRDGRVISFRVYHGDDHEVDAFWA